MISFKQFCQLAKNPKFVQKPWRDNYGDLTSVPVSGAEYKTLMDGLRNAKIFVFQGGSEEFSHTIKAELRMVKLDHVFPASEKDIKDSRTLTFQEIDLDVPFEATFFEAIDSFGRPVRGSFNVQYIDGRGRPNDGDFEILEMKDKPPAPFVENSGSIPTDLADSSFESYTEEKGRNGGMLILEISPRTYLKFQHMIQVRRGREVGEKIFMTTVKEDEDVERDDVADLRLYLGKLKDGYVGHENVDESVRIASRTSSPKTDRKNFVHISKIIRVSPNKEIVRSIGSREVDWSHRWMVRGHWRKHNGLGKNRSGEYSVSGYTWVVEHEKGPEGAPLVADKVRLFKETK